MQDEDSTYAFFVNESEIIADLKSVIAKEKVSTESAITIICQPQAVFKVSL